MRVSWIVGSFLIGFACCQSTAGRALAQDRQNPEDDVSSESVIQWRQPCGLWVDADAHRLWVALRMSGACVAIDPATRRIVALHQLGGRLESLAGARQGPLVVADSKNKRLVVLDPFGTEHSIRQSISTSGRPMQVVTDVAGLRAWASLRYEQAVEAFEIESGRLVYRAALGFAPHCLAVSPDGSVLLVADAFRGNLVAMSAADGKMLRAYEYAGSNIRGLAFAPTGDAFAFAQQIFSEQAMITRDAVFWGALMTNNVRRVKLATFLDPLANPLLESRLYYLGDPGHGAGDPGPLAMTEDGTLMVCLSGVDQLAISREASYSFRREATGKRPTSVALAERAGKAFIANQFDDTISVLDLRSTTMGEPIPLGEKPTLTAANRGEALFHNARLSLDGWYSCHSCHTDGHTSGINADTLGDKTFGAPKNTPSLLGAGETGPWAWNGRFGTLEAQIDSSVKGTMQGAPLTAQQRADLVAYLQSLGPIAAERATADLERGKAVFAARKCANCHQAPTFTSKGVYDVGLNDGLGGNTAFNPPSLRGVRYTAPYLHDGRAKQLPEVFTIHRHQLNEALSPAELQALIAFLGSL